jgi:putative SOS response-associated peptidase YedK
VCGRFTLHVPQEHWLQPFEVQTDESLPPRFNIAPGQTIAAVRAGVQRRELVKLRWGLLPAWSKSEQTDYRMINARVETVATKPAFRTAFRQRRCLIPADGFYEWRPAGRSKQPFYFTLTRGEVFAFAGLWEHWEGEDGRVIESCTLLVTVANALVLPVHDRMPVILDPADYSTWLDHSHYDANRLQGLLQPYPAEAMTAHPVSARVNSPRNDDAECIAPLSE